MGSFIFNQGGRENTSAGNTSRRTDTGHQVPEKGFTKAFRWRLTAGTLCAFSFVSMSAPSLAVMPPFHPRVQSVKQEISIKSYTLRIYRYQYGASRSEWRCLEKLWHQESRWNHRSKNPKSTAMGIAQLLNETSLDPHVQVNHGLKYIQSRYDGSACLALRHEHRKGWY